MRILLVNVNTSVAATAEMAAAAMAKAAPGTEVVGLTPAYGAAGVDSNVQSLIASVAVMDAVRGYANPYDAVVIGGFGEHGREGLQELVEVPVLDIAECAAHVAMMLGRTFSVVTTLQRSVAQVEDRLLLAGLMARCASVRPVGLATRELDDDPAAATSAIVAASRRCVDDDHAEVIVLGCGGMAGLDAVVSAAVGVPVVDGVAAAVAVAESLVRLGLRTSSVGSTALPDLSATTWPTAPGDPDV
ncbi:aspartate/glutamate racemase family protein [Acidothermaceae bacterium B102]|nr:aspartate/glutamate racemase family protein [Acidothermaceae bacterium B102]